MRFTLATEDLELNGRNFAGFPLLLRDDCQAMEPAQSFLWELLGTNSRCSAPKTWEKYGRDLYDYFAYVYANDLDWTQSPIAGTPTPLDAYIEWSKGLLENRTRTINGRTRLISRFYRWAKEKKFVEKLPFDQIVVRSSAPATFFSHVHANPQEVATTNVLLREERLSVKLITKEQVKICLTHLSNRTHRLMFELMTRTGLRQGEARTFPERYIFNPADRPDLARTQMIMVDIKPKHMEIKGGHERTIEVPYTLMEDLWWWSVRDRQKRENNNSQGQTFPHLFLTEAGCPYGETAYTSIFNRLKKRCGFHLTPHMCRHTYATYRLWSLKRSTTFTGDPLLYIMDRLGHSSVLTTKGYLSLINQLEGQLVLLHEDELNDLFAQESHQ